MDVKQLEQTLATLQNVQDKLEVLDEIAAHYYEEDNFQKAVTYYQQAEKMAPKGNPRAYYQGLEGICYFLMNQDEKAYLALTGAKAMLRPAEKDFDPERKMFGPSVKRNFFDLNKKKMILKKKLDIASMQKIVFFRFLRFLWRFLHSWRSYRQ